MLGKNSFASLCVAIALMLTSAQPALVELNHPLVPDEPAVQKESNDNIATDGVTLGYETSDIGSLVHKAATEAQPNVGKKEGPVTSYKVNSKGSMVRMSAKKQKKSSDAPGDTKAGEALVRKSSKKKRSAGAYGSAEALAQGEVHAISEAGAASEVAAEVQEIESDTPQNGVSLDTENLAASELESSSGVGESTTTRLPACPDWIFHGGCNHQHKGACTKPGQTAWHGHAADVQCLTHSNFAGWHCPSPTTHKCSISSSGGGGSTTTTGPSWETTTTRVSAEIHHGGGEGSCFAGTTQVLMEGGVERGIATLQGGDRILGFNKRGETFTDYYLADWHKGEQSPHLYHFLEIHHEKQRRPLRVTELHLLFLSSPNGGRGLAVPAKEVQIGDSLLAASEDGEPSGMVASKVLKIQDVWAEGIYAPLTASGTLIVDGVAASVVEISSPLFAKAWDSVPQSQRDVLLSAVQLLLLPLRLLHYTGFEPSAWVPILRTARRSLDAGTTSLSNIGIYNAFSWLS